MIQIVYIFLYFTNINKIIKKCERHPEFWMDGRVNVRYEICQRES